jgi:branched-chain amino acid transport system substrate-binding protein
MPIPYRVRSATCILFLFASFIVGCGTQTNSTPNGQLNFGVITIQSGGDAAYGVDTKNGLELALGSMKDAPVKPLYADSKEDPQEALRVFKELAAKGVTVVVGPFASTEVRQVAPEAQRQGIVLITTSATADDLSTIGDHVFMMLPPNSRQGADQAKFAYQHLNSRRAAVLRRQNAYGQSLSASFDDQFRKLGGNIVAEESFPDQTEDFRNHLRKLAGKGADTVFIAAHAEDTGRILRQAKEVRFPKVAFLGGDGSMTDDMFKQAGGAGEGSIFSNVAAVDPDFEKAFQAKYGTAPSGYSATAYDTAMILAELAHGGARTSDQFQKGLVGLQGHAGASGLTRFTQVDKSYWCLDKQYRQFEAKNNQFSLIR